jgi:hypothetical protein
MSKIRETKEEAKQRLSHEKIIKDFYAKSNAGRTLKVGDVIIQTLTNAKYEVLELNVGHEDVVYNPKDIFSETSFKTKMVEKGSGIYAGHFRNCKLGEINYFSTEGLTEGYLRF